MSWSHGEVYTSGKFEINYSFSWFGTLIFKNLNVIDLTAKGKKVYLDLVK
jgi:hypothetical protein